MTKKTTIFILAAATLLLQAMYFVWGQSDISLQENRTLSVFKPFTFKGFLEGSFQNELESALKDQAFGRRNMIEMVNTLKSINKTYVNYAYDIAAGKNESKGETIPDEDIPVISNSSEPPDIHNAISVTAGSLSDLPAPVSSLSLPTPSPPIHVEQQIKLRLQPKGNIYSMNGTDYLTRYPLLENNDYKEGIRIKGNQIQEMMKRNPGVKVYAYYLTKSEDLKWFDESEGIKSFDYAQYVKEHLPPAVTFGKMVFKSFEEYMQASNKTDHHWNNAGSYRGYTEIYEMLSKDYPLSPMKKPVSELDFNGLQWLGSKAGEAGVKVNSDDFKAYEYDLGTYESYLGDKIKELGAMQQYKDGTIPNRSPSVDHYTNYYGAGEEGQIVKHVFPGNQYNLLLISDSNNKPVRRVLASHFSTTVVLDYRALKNYYLDDVINKNKIDIVLFVAQCKYWADTNSAKLNGGARYLFRGYPIIRD